MVTFIIPSSTGLVSLCQLNPKRYTFDLWSVRVLKLRLNHCFEILPFPETRSCKIKNLTMDPPFFLTTNARPLVVRSTTALREIRRAMSVRDTHSPFNAAHLFRAEEVAVICGPLEKYANKLRSMQ